MSSVCPITRQNPQLFASCHIYEHHRVSAFLSRSKSHLGPRQQTPDVNSSPLQRFGHWCRRDTACALAHQNDLRQGASELSRTKVATTRRATITTTIRMEACHQLTKTSNSSSPSRRAGLRPRYYATQLWRFAIRAAALLDRSACGAPRRSV